MIVKKEKVLEWNVDDSKNDGYLSTGSFPISIGSSAHFQSIKTDKTPILMILESDVAIVAKSRAKSHGEFRSITKKSKDTNIFEEFSSNNISIQKYIGYSTFYKKYNIIKGVRGDFRIKKGIIIKLFSTNNNRVYILEVIDDKLNEWRSYQSKPIIIEDHNKKIDTGVKNSLKHTKEELLKKINNKKNSPLETTAIIIKTYNRDPNIVAYTLKTANGKCQFCGNSSFKKKDNYNYLEVHHIIPLSKKGEDSIANTIALCPNCHREMHYGKNKKDLKTYLLNDLKKKEYPKMV